MAESAASAGRLGTAALPAEVAFAPETGFAGAPLTLSVVGGVDDFTFAGGFVETGRSPRVVGDDCLLLGESVLDAIPVLVVLVVQPLRFGRLEISEVSEDFGNLRETPFVKIKLSDHWPLSQNSARKSEVVMISSPHGADEAPRQATVPTLQ